MKENNSVEEQIIYTIKNIGDTVIFGIHYQSPKITSAEEAIGFKASTGFVIGSAYHTQLGRDCVWIKGTKENDKGVDIREFKSEHEAKAYVDKVNEAFKEFKESGYIMKPYEAIVS